MDKLATKTLQGRRVQYAVRTYCDKIARGSLGSAVNIIALELGRILVSPLVLLVAVLVCHSTDLPAYSDTVYSDTPLTLTVLAVPNWPFIYKTDVVTVTPLLQ